MSFQYGWITQIYDALKKRFASNVQGAKADSALQPASIGVSVQAYNNILAALTALGPTTGLIQKTGAAEFSAVALEGSQVLTSQIAQGRLTLQNNVPVPTGNLINLSTLYYTPFTGNVISLWDGSDWAPRSFNQLSLDLTGLLADTLYDIFIYDDAGTLRLKAVPWANSNPGTSVRTTEIQRLNGIWVEPTTIHRFLGSILTTSTQRGEDSENRRFVWNLDNQRERVLRKAETSDYTYNQAAIRPANGDPNNGVAWITGLPQILRIDYFAILANDAYFTVGINSSAQAYPTAVMLNTVQNAANVQDGVTCAGNILDIFSGYNFALMLEASPLNGTTVYYYGANTNFGLTGFIGNSLGIRSTILA